MDNSQSERVTVQASVQAPLSTVWSYWTEPEHIQQWNKASSTWHTPKAENDLREGGSFLTRMEAKDGSIGFDFVGTYTTVLTHQQISYTMANSRKVDIHFTDQGQHTLIVQIFEPEQIHPPEYQQEGWQAILNSFKRYAEQGAN